MIDTLSDFRHQGAAHPNRSGEAREGRPTTAATVAGETTAAMPSSRHCEEGSR
jgi:hypothetical protein